MFYKKAVLKNFAIFAEDEQHIEVVVVQRSSVKKLFLEISQYSQENTCARVSFSMKLEALMPAILLKETLA